jgi:2-aminoethylphosphonate-pyruvate transaminase
MNIDSFPDNPYILLTPGPLSTTKTVKGAMLRDWCTWDDEYNTLVQDIRASLVNLATRYVAKYTAVLMQGSGTFSIESVIGSVVPRNGKLLVLTNGAYGQRIVTISTMLGIHTVVHDSGELLPPDIEALKHTLENDPGIGHVVMVHNETTTGMMNPVKEISGVIQKYGRIFILDAMSSFGGVPMDMDELGIHFMVSSANKAIQGVPGFGFIIARRDLLEQCAGMARSHSLDLYDQWRVMDEQKGKWRFTSPTHTVRAFYQALIELKDEGGIEARNRRYRANHRTLVDGMLDLGFRTLLPDIYQSPIITSFHNPENEDYSFIEFYNRLKKRGFVIYPGKVTSVDTFRIGHIGDITPDDMKRLVEAIRQEMFWKP